MKATHLNIGLSYKVEWLCKAILHCILPKYPRLVSTHPNIQPNVWVRLAEPDLSASTAARNGSGLPADYSAASHCF